MIIMAYRLAQSNIKRFSFLLLPCSPPLSVTFVPINLVVLLLESCASRTKPMPFICRRSCHQTKKSCCPSSLLAHGSHSQFSPIMSLANSQPSKARKETHTAKVPALTGIALTRVGAMPLQNPLAPSLAQVCPKASLIFLNLCSLPNPSVCIFDLITSKG